MCVCTALLVLGNIHVIFTFFLQIYFIYLLKLTNTEDYENIIDHSIAQL